MRFDKETDKDGEFVKSIVCVIFEAGITLMFYFCLSNVQTLYTFVWVNEKERYAKTKCQIMAKIR
jgi:hypothetical protein